MGASKVDLYKKEREYEHLSLSDKNVIKYLILFRSQVDVLCGASINININQAGDIYDFNQELIVLYASLDVLLENIKLKENDRRFLHLIFEGNDMQDVIEVHGFPRMTAYRILSRVSDKVVLENHKRWKDSMMRKDCDDSCFSITEEV